MISLRLSRSVADDPDFVDAIELLISGFIKSSTLEHFAVVKIDNWFDDKWVNFTGVLRSYSGYPEFHYAADIPRTYTRTKALPPFARSRVEELWTIGEPRENAAGVFYFTGNSKENGRGALLASIPVPGHRTWEWYVGFANPPDWRPVRFKNVARNEVRIWTQMVVNNTLERTDER